MSTEDELRRALQVMAVAEPVDLPALGARVRTRTGARRRRRLALAGAVVAVVTCLGLVTAVATTRHRTPTAAVACPQPLPPGYQRIDTHLGGLSGTIPPGWVQDTTWPTGPAVSGAAVQISDHAPAGAFITYRYDPAPQDATLKEYVDAANAGDRYGSQRVLRAEPIPYGTAQQAWDSELLISFGASHVQRRDWWNDGRIYSVFFVAPTESWDGLAAVRQVVLDASRPC